MTGLLRCYKNIEPNRETIPPAALDDASFPANFFSRIDDPVVEALVIALAVVVVDELPDRVAVSCRFRFRGRDRVDQLQSGTK